MLPTEIATERCRLTAPDEGDWPCFRALDRDPLVRRFLGGPVWDEDRLRRRFEASMRPAEGGCWSVRSSSDGGFVGLVSVGRHHDPRRFEVSYRFVPERWGWGLAREAVGAVVDRAAPSLGRRRIEAETQRANLRSRRLLEGIGMAPIEALTRFDAEQVVYGLPTRRLRARDLLDVLVRRRRK